MAEAAPRRLTFMKGIVYLILVGLALAGLAAFALYERGHIEPVRMAEGAPKPIPVRIGTVEKQSGLEIREGFSGLTRARRSSVLGFESGGRVQRMNVDLGDRVEQGQVLAALDTRSLRAQLAAAEAQITEANAALKLAEQTVNRQRELVEKKLLSNQRFDEITANADTSRARIEAARASADTLRVRIDLAKITAPYSGVITQRYLDEGAIAGPTSPVFELVEADRLEVVIGVPDTVALGLVPGESYELEISGQTVSAELRAVTNVIRSNRRTVDAVFEIANSGQTISGAVARLKYDQTIETEGFWVPVSAMTEANRGLWSVYAIADAPDGNGDVVEKRLVEIVHAEADRAYVRGAFENDERFVSDGLHRLTPGMRVTPSIGPLASGK